MKISTIILISMGIFLGVLIIIVAGLVARKVYINNKCYEGYTEQIKKLSHPWKRNTKPIPKIIHQVWINPKGPGTIPDNYKQWSSECRKLHPEYKYMLWDGPKSRQFIAEQYPWFLSTWDSYDVSIKRIDSIRYLFLHHYGGIYMDMDFICMKKLDNILEGAEGHAIFGYQSSNTKSNDAICNALMISPPGHHLLEIIIKCLEKTKKLHVLHATGPTFLTKAVNTYPHNDIILYKMPLIYTQTYADVWFEKSCKNQKECTNNYERSYTSTPWGGGWVDFKTIKSMLV